MKKIEALRTEAQELRDDIVRLSELDDITPEQDAELDAKIERYAAVSADLERAEARQSIVDSLAERKQQTGDGAADFQIQRKTATDVDARTAAPGEVRDAARKLLDEARWADADRLEAVERAMFKSSMYHKGDAVARMVVATENDDYRNGWLKTISGNSYGITPAEGEAMSRAQALSPNTAGGLGVPVIIDPTIMLADGRGLTGILSVARIETITNDKWRGVTSAGTTWSFDAEAAEVSDDSIELAQPEVEAHMASGFIPYSIEIGQDYPGFASEMSKVFAESYQRLLAETLATGTGTPPVPTGVFAGVNAVTTSRVPVTTAGTFGDVDIDKVWAAVPEMFRDRATWFMSVDIENRIRAFGDEYNRFTVDQTAGGISLLNGKRVILSDYAPNFTGVTAGTARNILVVGDFSNYLVAQRLGMTIDLVPHLFGTGSNRPTGQRGWYAYTRVGAGVVVPNGLRVLRNTA